MQGAQLTRKLNDGIQAAQRLQPNTINNQQTARSACVSYILDKARI